MQIEIMILQFAMDVKGNFAGGPKAAAGRSLPCQLSPPFTFRDTSRTLGNVGNPGIADGDLSFNYFGKGTATMCSFASKPRRSTP